MCLWFDNIMIKKHITVLISFGLSLFFFWLDFSISWLMFTLVSSIHLLSKTTVSLQTKPWTLILCEDNDLILNYMTQRWMDYLSALVIPLTIFVFTLILWKVLILFSVSCDCNITTLHRNLLMLVSYGATISE